MSKYISLYENLRDEIIKGNYKPGTKLASKRVTADNYGVSLVTVEHAYELLLEEGYIVSKERSGYFVSFDLKENETPSHSVRHKEIERLINHKSDVTMNFPYSIYIKTVRRVLSDFDDEIMSLSPNFGTDYLRQTISDYLQRSRQISVKPENIIVGAGARYLYGLIIEALGTDIIYGLESPSYEGLEKIYESKKAKIEPLKLASDGIDSRALLKTQAKVLHITPYRSYPTGVTATASKKREYINFANQRDGIIIEDDVLSEFSPSRKKEETLYGLDKNGHVIYVNSFTKTIGEAVRIAYMAVPDPLISLFEEKIGFYASTVPTLNQYILAQLIESGDFERHINRVRRSLRRDR